MTSEEKKISMTRQQQTAAITPSIVKPQIDPPVIKGSNRSTKQGRAREGNLLMATAPLTGSPAPEDTLIDVDAYGDGMAFRFIRR